MMTKAEYIFLLLLLLWCGAILLTPVAAQYGGIAGASAEVSYRVFGHVCHQWDSHSFHIAGRKLPVCIRCSMIYLSFLVGSLIAVLSNAKKLFSKNAKYVLLAVLSPLLLDVILNMAGIHQSTTLSRIVSGAIAGTGFSLVLAPVCIDVVHSLLPSHKPFE
jgi:uncharacterized membrane protein